MGPYRKLRQVGLVFLTLLVVTACAGSTSTAVPSAPMSTATPAPTQASKAVAPAGTTTAATATPVPTRTPALSTDPTAVADEFGDGVWRIGVDITPGLYRAEASDGCSWRRISGFSGSSSEIIAIENPSGPSLVSISSTDAGFESKRCGTWIRADTVVPPPLDLTTEKKPTAGSPRVPLSTATPTPTPIPTDTATPRPVPTPIPIQGFEGTGQQVSAQFELFEGVSLFTMTHDGSGHFDVQLLDEGGQLVALLANETGGFEGSKAVGIKEGGRRAQPGTHILNISADGNWTVSIEQ